MTAMPRIVVAGTASGVGKTTVATGLMAALTTRGRKVAGFKVGPDFIDPSYHAVATGRAPRNLDAFLSGPDLIAPLFAHGAADADIAVVEGVMGLFDGASGRGELASTAHVAKLLDAPVVLVVDAWGLAGSVAAMVYGYATFEPAVRLAGVVANRVGSPRHASLLREALTPLGIPLLGVLSRDDQLTAPSRHLGLVPAAERRREAERTVSVLGEHITDALDLTAVERIAAAAPPLDVTAWQPPARATATLQVAVAQGPAFSFSYTENLELLAAAGAELATFDPTVDEQLPAGAAALYLGGGFPEAHADALSGNARLRRDVKAFAAAGRPVLAECGGLLYLCQSLDGAPMCGVLDAEARMSGRLTLGYREAVSAADSVAFLADTRVAAHEFHHSTVTPATGATPAWRWGDDHSEGFVTDTVHASYLHTHWAATPHVPARFVEAAR